jgi:hypothetical protein
MRYETLRDKPSSLLTWTRARRGRGMRSVVNSFTFPLVRGYLNPAPLGFQKETGPSFWRKSGGFEAKRVHTVHEVSEKLA